MEDHIRKPKKLSLYKALSIGYLRNEAKQGKRLKAFGYRIVPDLTNREHLVAFNPTSQKLLYVSQGTDFSNSTDVQNDILGAVGAQRLSRRREEEKAALEKARSMLKPRDTVLVSHSLGSQYTNYIARPTDRVIQYNPFYTPGATARPNVQNYREGPDVVSAFAPKANTTTLSDTKSMLKAHSIDNIKAEPIFI